MSLQQIRVALIEPTWLHGDGTGDEAFAELASAHPNIRFQRAPYDGSVSRRPGDAVLAALTDADAALCLDFPADCIATALRLRWVQSVSAGIERLPLARFHDAGIVVTSAAGAAAPEIAEFVFARILEERKRLEDLAASARVHQWQPSYGSALSGSTIGLIGFGAINQRVAHLASAFDMRILVARRSAADSPLGVSRTFPLDELSQMLSHCEVLVAALPETDETVGLLSHKELAALPSGALLINVGRGSVLDEAALLDAVRAGRLRAALDVLTTEPPADDDPLWGTPGIRISAHCSSVPTATIHRVIRLFSENLHRLKRAEPLHNQQYPSLSGP